MPVDRSHPTPTRSRSGPDSSPYGFRIETPSGGPDCAARHDFAHSLRQGTSVSPLGTGGAQIRWHRPEQPPREMALRQREPPLATSVTPTSQSSSNSIGRSGERRRILRHDHRFEREEGAALRVDRYPDPVDVGAAVGLNPREISEEMCRIQKRLIDLEVVRVTMN